MSQHTLTDWIRVIIRQEVAYALEETAYHLRAATPNPQPAPKRPKAPKPPKAKAKSPAKPPPQAAGWKTLQELQAEYGLTHRQLVYAVNTKRLTAIRRGRAHVVKVDGKFRQWLGERSRQSSEPPSAPPSSIPAPSPPELPDLPPLSQFP